MHRRKEKSRCSNFSYRKTSRVDVSDSEKSIKWLKRKKYADCFRVPAPEVAKAEVKKLIDYGVNVTGCAVVEDRSYSEKFVSG